MTALHVGAALRLMRMESGLGLREVARRIGVSGAYLSRVEHGHDAPPSADRLIGIAGALGVPPDLLLELTHDLPPAAAAYLRETPGAMALLMELVRRRPGAAQLARLRAELERAVAAPQNDARTPRRIGPLLAESRVVLGLVCGTLEDALDLAAARLAAEAPAGSARQLAEQMRRPELLGAALLGAGMAVPHAALPGLRRRAAIISLMQPLAVAENAKEPVEVVLALSGPPDRDATVQLLLQAARLAGYGFARQVAACRTPGNVLSVLDGMEAAIG